MEGTMHRFIKVTLTACFLGTIAYFANLGAAGGHEFSAKTTAHAKTARAKTGKLQPAKASAITLPAGFQSPCGNAVEHSLPLPSAVSPAQFVDFEKRIHAFLKSGAYKKARQQQGLGWCGDKGSNSSPVRDTGQFVQGKYYGTHPAVKIYYSPKVMEWLVGGRQGDIPDGAMIIKEQYHPPAARYVGMTEDQLPPVSDWTIMIKDAKGAKDGWFWGEFFDGMTYDDDQPPFNYPWAGFGLYCLRCHATAEKQHTFAALNNIEGFPGLPLTFFDDGSWRTTSLSAAAQNNALQFAHAQLARTQVAQSQSTQQPDPDFLRAFNSIPGVPLADVQKMPSETYDHIPMPGVGPEQFISSSQCMSCHAALNGPFGPTMFLPSRSAEPGTPDGANVSPYGEWRWSPMGLAGRDPIFFAQLESEFAYLNTLPAPQNEQMVTSLRNACLTCHGAMGKRQLDADTPGGNGDFKLEFLQLTDRSDSHFKYGALARDGISCTICHRNAPTQTPPGQNPLQYFLENSTTGHFQVTPADKLFGPFKDDEIAPKPMENGVGIKPEHNAYIQSSRMCGSCHTIDLPVVDGRPNQFSIEQATYLEWLNSQYQTEFGTPGPNAQSCQACHMTGSYHSEKKGIRVDQIKDKIAIIEDQAYPAAEHRLEGNDINVRVREKGYARHTFLGLNVTLLELFNQFNEILGVRKDDYMSGSKTGLQDTIDNYTQQAQERTVKLTLSTTVTGAQQVKADVSLTNLAGHRFPSGVGFRRAFIELLVFENKNGQQNLVWGSGRTNKLGMIVDGNGQVLPSEFFTEYKDSKGVTQQYYQPHHQMITSQDQVQIYEELIKNAEGKFTTSFIRRDQIVKENRLLPIGWSEHGPDPSLNGRYLEATHPEGAEVLADPDYQMLGGQGTDRISYLITLPPGVDASKCTVQATLYYQSTPPYYLDNRFRTAPTGDATKRLYYLASNLNTTGTAIENWKLKIVSTSAPAVLATPLPTSLPPGNHTVLILEPRGSGAYPFAPIKLSVRLDNEINRNTLRAFLNGQEITGLFSPASRLACSFTVCDLTATATPGDGLVQGRNALRVEVRNADGLRSAASQIFFTQ
jgi:mono/diheme cytochrome c family protein